MTNTVLHDRRGPAFWITLNRREKRNAINTDVIAGISDGIAAAQAELAATAEKMVASLAGTSPSALRRGKYAMRVVEAMSFDQAIAFAEGQLGLMTLTGDAQEGLAAFNEKRAPDFKGT